MITPEWISAIASSLSLIAIIALVWQVKVNHDKGRREKAIQIMKDWGKVVTPDLFRYSRLMFQLRSEDEVSKVAHGQSLTLDKEVVSKYLPELVTQEILEDKSIDKITLPVELVVSIRYTMVSMLNAIETIAIAYKHEVADQEMIKEVFFGFLITSGYLANCKDFISNFSNGGWPVLQEFPALLNPPKKRKRPTSLFKKEAT